MTPAAPRPGPFPLTVTGPDSDRRYVIVTNQGKHWASTFDPHAARLIVSEPDLLAALSAAKMSAEIGMMTTGHYTISAECYVNLCTAILAATTPTTNGGK